MDRLWKIFLAQLGVYILGGGAVTSVLAGIAAGGTSIEVLVIEMLINSFFLFLNYALMTFGKEFLQRFLPKDFAERLAQRIPISNSLFIRTIAVIGFAFAPLGIVLVAAYIVTQRKLMNVYFAMLFLLARLFSLIGIVLIGNGIVEHAGQIGVIGAISFLLGFALIKHWRKRKNGKKE